jgi:hypothetical protein
MARAPLSGTSRNTGFFDQVGGEDVHDHAQQFVPSDVLAAEDADDGVVAGSLEVARFPAPRDLQQVIDELRRQGLGSAFDLGVAVERRGIGAGVVLFSLVVLR